MQKNPCRSFSLLLFVVLAVFSCGKDSDYEGRFVGTWASVKYQNNGNEISTTISDKLELKADKTYSRRVITRHPLTLDVVSDSSTNGLWTAEESSKRLSLSDSNANEVSMQVNDITETKLAVSYSVGSIPVLIEFEKQ